MNIYSYNISNSKEPIVKKLKVIDHGNSTIKLISQNGYGYSFSDNIYTWFIDMDYFNEFVATDEMYSIVGLETAYGLSKRIIFPCRDFCLLVGYTALEGSKNGCIIIDDKGLIYIYDGNLIKRYMRLNELGI